MLPSHEEPNHAGGNQRLALSFALFCRLLTVIAVVSASARWTHQRSSFTQSTDLPAAEQPTTRALKSFSRNCTDGSPAEVFEVRALLGLIGKPSLVSDSDIALLEEGFTLTYNELLDCSLSEASRVLDKAVIIYNGTTTNTTNNYTCRS